MSTNANPKNDPTKALGQMVRMLRTLSPDMPMQQADVLLAVAYKPGLTMSQLQAETGLSQSSVSRNIMAMSKFHRLGKPGLNLVESVPDPREPRRRLVFLTAFGKTFITKLIRVMDADYSIDKETDARVEIERMHEEAQAQQEAKSDRGRAGKIKA